MARFAYKAVTSAGETIEDHLDAADRSAVVRRLHDLGYVAIRVDEIHSSQALADWFKKASRSRLPRRELTLITRALATLLAAGLPLDRALASLKQFSRSDRGKELVQGLHERVRDGSSLSASLSGLEEVPEYYAGLVRAGEASGKLASVLNELAETLERNDALRAALQSALRYPLIVLLFAFGAIVLLMTAVIPQFRGVFESAGLDTLPISTRIILGISGVMTSYGLVLLVFALVAGVAFYRYARSPIGRSRLSNLLWKLPRIGTIAEAIDVARVCRTFGTLLQNGVPAVEAIEMASKVATKDTFGRSLLAAGQSIRQGRSIVDALGATGHFPELACQLLNVGEQSGELDKMLIRTAGIYEQESRTGIDELLALLVPITTAALGILVALIIGSIFSAILQSYRIAL